MNLGDLKFTEPYSAGRKRCCVVVHTGLFKLKESAIAR